MAEEIHKDPGLFVRLALYSEAEICSEIPGAICGACGVYRKRSNALRSERCSTGVRRGLALCRPSIYFFFFAMWHFDILFFLFIVVFVQNLLPRGRALS